MQGFRRWCGGGARGAGLRGCRGVSSSTNNSNFLLNMEKKQSLALTTWFCSPDLGMTDFEVLIRSSAFLVKSKVAKGPGYHILTSSHNLAPWRFRNYYPEPFLEYVNEGHIHYTVELRNANGESIISVDILPNSFHHPTRDIGMVHFDEDEAEALSMFKTLKFEKTDIENYQAQDGERIEFHGHEVVTDESSANADTIEGKDNRLSVPKVYAGEIHGRSAHQTFCSSFGTPLSQGMCGGPVIGSRGSICGMVEGIVPVDHSDESLQGKAVIIESSDILKFVSDVEESILTNDSSSDLIFLEGGKIAEKIIGEDALANKKDYEDPLQKIQNVL